MLLLSSADIFRINFFKQICLEHNQIVKQFGSRSGRDLGPNCLQKLQADDKSQFLIIMESPSEYSGLISPGH